MERKVRGDQNDASRLVDDMGEQPREQPRDTRLFVLTLAVIIGITFATIALSLANWPWLVATLTGGLTGAE